MLTIQPKVLSNYRPVFKSNEEENFNLAGMNEDSYESLRGDIKAQKKDLEDLINSTEAKFPKFIKKLMKAGVILTTALLGGMATGWGAGKSIKGIQELSKKVPVQNAKNSIKSGFKFIGRQFVAAKKWLQNTGLYKKIAAKTTKFFTENKFGKKLVSIYKKLTNNKVINPVKDNFKSLTKKVKEIKGETYKKATVNTVGISGGIASGANAIKEDQKRAGEE